MCGIIGAVTVRPFETSVLQQALEKIKHRGPDDRGIYRDGDTSLGAVRLSIIDTGGGHQPILNEDSTVAVVLNGEIYNYIELREELKSCGHVFQTRTDTEVLVHLYEQEGLKFLDRLRGMFAFALWDKRRRRLVLARDRFGKKPLYYFHSPREGFVFASELKALKVMLQALGVELTTDPSAISDFLSLACIPQPTTIYKEVRSVEAGALLEVTEGKCRKGRYWSADAYSEPVSRPYEELLEEVRGEIRTAVKLRLRTDVPFGLLLSGGIDSTIVALEAASLSEQRLKTFTIGSADTSLDESGFAAETAARLKTDHTLLSLNAAPCETIRFLASHFDQPFADPSAIPTYEVARLARQHVKAVLNGDGGDELFGGYRRYLAAYRARQFARVPRVIPRTLGRLLGRATEARRSKMGFLARFLRGLSASEGERFIIWSADMLRDSDKQTHCPALACRRTENFIAENAPVGGSLARRLMMTDLRIALPSYLLVKMDMASMAASVEARSPLLDHKLAELSFTIPDRLLFSKNRTKAVLRDAYAPHLPKDVITRRKLGFEIPLAKWLQADLKPLLNDTLGSSGSRVCSFVDRDLVKELLAGSGLQDRNLAMILYAMLVLELWLRE